jgi:prephenate dehydratase
LDFLGNIKEDRCAKALAHLAEVTNFLRVLGCYKKAEK